MPRHVYLSILLVSNMKFDLLPGIITSLSGWTYFQVLYFIARLISLWVGRWTICLVEQLISPFIKPIIIITIKISCSVVNLFVFITFNYLVNVKIQIGLCRAPFCTIYPNPNPNTRCLFFSPCASNFHSLYSHNLLYSL